MRHNFETHVLLLMVQVKAIARYKTTTRYGCRNFDEQMHMRYGSA